MGLFRPRAACYLGLVQALVTGATGFVGRTLVRALAADGVSTVITTRRSERAAALRTLKVQVREATLADPNQLAEAAEGCDVVFHCAGVASHRAATEVLPWLHVAGVENLLHACEAVGVRRVVLLSCADATLRNVDRLNWREQQPLSGSPVDAWSRTKLMGEEVALQRSGARLEVTAVRPAFLWGPDDDVNLPDLCDDGLRGGIRLFSAGAGLFSSAHVDNVVHAMRLCAQAEAAPGQAFHISDGAYQTAHEFFNALSHALGLPLPRRGLYPLHYASAWLRTQLGFSGPCPADVVRRGRACLLDIQRAINDLDYSPTVSVEAGMRGLQAWAAQTGGADAIARRLRGPASIDDAQVFQRLAEAEPGQS